MFVGLNEESSSKSVGDIFHVSVADCVEDSNLQSVSVWFNELVLLPCVNVMHHSWKIPN